MLSLAAAVYNSGTADVINKSMVCATPTTMFVASFTVSTDMRTTERLLVN